MKPSALPRSMNAVDIQSGALVNVTLPLPQAASGEVLIKVAYVGVNRADLLQLKGLYPMPKGASTIPGLEVSGTIVALGKNVKDWKPGDKVCALITGGGYAEYCTAPAALLLPLGKKIGLKEGAALAEALYTVSMALLVKGTLKKGESVLIHSGASGIGTMAIQVAKAIGATVYASAGTDKKCRLCKKLGAKQSINYKTQDFAAELKKTGVDVVLDTTGGDNLSRNIGLLNPGGRVVVIGFLRGSTAEIRLTDILFKGVTITGAALRGQSLANKKTIKKHIDTIYPKLLDGTITPVIDHVFTLSEAKKALQRMEQNLNIGKIVLQV